jgi:hypothetical protein
LWKYQDFRFTMRLTTIVWGLGFLLEVAIRSYLVFALTIQQFLIISPFVFYSFLGGLALWTFLYSRKGRKEIEVILRPSDTATEVSTTEETVA